MRKERIPPIQKRVFRQYLSIYTKSGRRKIYHNVKANKTILRNLAANPDKRKTVEYCDNRLALFVGQNGKCAVSKQPLFYDDMFIHHIVPTEYGGTDEYANLIYVTGRMSYFINAPLYELSQYNLWPYELNKRGFEKLNRYRLLCGNDGLCRETMLEERKIQMENELNIMKRDVVDIVAERIMDLNKREELNIPRNYSVANAIKASWLILQELKGKNGKTLYETVPKNNIANALLSMVIQGLDPNKNQCYFIIYGEKLILQRSYFGSMALAMRVDNTIKAILPEVIYKDDVFEYEKVKGRTVVNRHHQSLGNIDKKRIVGAYCTVIYKDGSEDNEIMSFDEIKQSWTMSKSNVIDDKGSLVAGTNHEKFTAEACKKTVANRVCKRIINSSDDKMYYAKFIEDETYMPERFRADSTSDDGIEWSKLDAATEPPLLVDEDGVVIEDCETEDSDDE
jgi:recombination protein RecT